MECLLRCTFTLASSVTLATARTVIFQTHSNPVRFVLLLSQLFSDHICHIPTRRYKTAGGPNPADYNRNSHVQDTTSPLTTRAAPRDLRGGCAWDHLFLNSQFNATSRHGRKQLSSVIVVGLAEIKADNFSMTPVTGLIGKSKERLGIYYMCPK